MSLALCFGMALSFVLADTSQTSGIRVYRERNAQGEEVLHVTNLDESGRRIGGEIEPTDTPTRADTQCRNNEETTPAPPVIINVYTNGQPQEILDGYEGNQSWYPYYGYARFAAAPWLRRARPHRSADQPEEFFGRPRIIDTRPYTRATAAQRNHAAFHRD